MFAYLRWLSVLLVASVAAAQGPPTGPANCASATTLFCLAGRTGSTNNATISTTAAGTLKGSLAADAPLNLLAGHATDPGSVTIGSNITSLTDAGINNIFVIDYGAVSTSGANDLVEMSLGMFSGSNPWVVSDHASEFRYGYVDVRTWQQASGIGGDTGTASPTTIDIATAYSFLANPTYQSNTGSSLNMQTVNAFTDTTQFARNGGALSHGDNYRSFYASPNFGGVTWAPGGFIPVGFLAAPQGTGSNLNYNAFQVADSYSSATQSISALVSNIGTTNSGNRFLSSTGAAPSTIVGTVRIGDTTVATQALEVKGNILLATNGATPGELRLQEPSSTDYTAFKAQTQAASVTYTLPAADGVGALTSNGSGTLTWTATASNTCAALTTVLCLAGRTTTTNDFTISTSGSQGGTIVGSSVGSAPLNLNSGTAGGLPGMVVLHSNVTTLDIDTAVAGKPFANIEIMPQNVTVTGDSLHDIIVVGRDMLTATNATVTLTGNALPSNNLGEYLTQGFVDYRTFVPPASTGYSGFAPAEGDLQMDEYVLARTEAIFQTSTGSHFNIRRVRPFIDAITYLDLTSGDFNYRENAHISFNAIPALGPGFTTGNLYTGLLVAPQTDSGSIKAQITGVDLDYINDDINKWIGINSDITSAKSGSRFLNHTGTAPSVHTGTFRIGDSTVATEKLEVNGNITMDNGGDGTITGTRATTDKSLILNGGAHDTTVASGYRIRLHAAGFGNIGNMGISGRTTVVGIGSDATFNNSLSTLQGTEILGTWTVSANIDSSLLSGGRGYMYRPTIVNSGNRTDLGTWMGFDATADIHAAASTTITTGQSWGYLDHTTIGTSNASSGNISGWSHVTVESAPFTGDGSGSTAIDFRIGLDYQAMTLNGTALSNSIAVNIAADNATNNYSINSSGANTRMLHAGPIEIGEDEADDIANTSIALEIKSNSRALRVSQMTNTERNALTGVTGMALYNTTTGSMNAYRNGAWVDSTPWNVVITKTADETVTNSSTYQDDDELFFSVASGETWIVDLVGGFGCSDATGDGKMTFTASSALFDMAQSNSNIWSSYNGSGILTPGGATAFGTTSEAVSGGTVICNGGTATTIWPFHIEYRFRTTASGTVKVQFANNAAASGRTTTLKAGAQLKARRVSAI